MPVEHSTQTTPPPVSPPAPQSSPLAAHDLVFYDGDCGFCHAWVRFAAKRDLNTRLRFAPIGGETFESRLSEQQRRAVPDSVVVLTRSGNVLVRGDAAVYLLGVLPRPWPWVGRALRFCPRPLRDAAYSLVARVRRSLFQAPASSCPLLPPDLARRFLP